MPHPKSVTWSWEKSNGSSRSSPSRTHMPSVSRAKHSTTSHSSRYHGEVDSSESYGTQRPTHRLPQQMTKDRSGSTIPTKGLEKMVLNNNAFLFAQSLLGYLKSTAEYLQLQEHRQIELLMETIVAALSSHPDPPEFIITALITVGTVAGVRGMDPEFELLTSELLIESLQRFLTWQRDLTEASGISSSGSSPLKCHGESGDDEDYKNRESGSDNTSISAAVAECQFDLIVLDDDENSTKQTTSRTRSPHANIELPSGTLTALDETTATLEIDGKDTLMPTVRDLIDFSSWEQLDSLSMTPSASNSVDSKGWQVMKTTTTTAGHALNPFDDDSEPVSEILEITLDQMDKVNLLKKNAPQDYAPTRTDIAELIHIFDSHLKDDYQNSSDGGDCGDRNCSTLDNGEADDEKEDSEDSTQDNDEDDDIIWPIQPHHRQKLKDELLSGKNALQVFVALDVFDMYRTLRQSIPPTQDGHETTYGALLAHQLLSKDRHRECIALLAKDIGPSVEIEQALLSRLLELGEEETIYMYIENDLGRCHRVLSHINHQLSFQFYYWGLVTPEMRESDPPEYADVSPIPGIGRARVQTKLVETAMALILYFDLEEDQQLYKFLDMFVRFCTVSTLLNQSSPSVKSLSSNDISQGPEKLQSGTALAAQIDGSAVSGKGKEYLLTTAWKYVPLVLEMTRGSETLQRMTIQHCIERRDLIMAKFLASKLDIMEYYLETVKSEGGRVVRATHPGSPLPEVALAAPKTRAFDWDGDQDMLDGTFPEMNQNHYRLQNFVDLKHIWFKIQDNNHGDKSNGKNNSLVKSNGGSKSDLLSGTLEAWSSLAPRIPGMYTIPGGLSGLLTKLCGHRLDKSEQCSQWEQRPLTTSQMKYAAADAKCLLDIYEALMSIKQI
ncbi:Exonuclease mut-7 [Linnemannia zychae]|nr:Exonuclease mut-7 [Linnemannia zychae]